MALLELALGFAWGRFVLVFILILQSARQVAPSGIKESCYRPPGYNPTHSTGNNGAQPSSVSR